MWLAVEKKLIDGIVKCQGREGAIEEGSKGERKGRRKEGRREEA